MCLLFKDMLPYLTLLSLILANVFLSNILYKQLLFLGIQNFAAIGLALLFCFFFCILVASLGLLLDTIMNLRTRSPESSPALDAPPPYCLVVNGEEGELPTYEDATMK